MILRRLELATLEIPKAEPVELPLKVNFLKIENI
jgi:hypothetical protein